LLDFVGSICLDRRNSLDIAIVVRLLKFFWALDGNDTTCLRRAWDVSAFSSVFLGRIMLIYVRGSVGC
jgi:hypothetical protein